MPSITPYLLFLQDYFEIIKNPIDLSTIDRRLSEGSYKDGWEVRERERERENENNTCICMSAHTMYQYLYYVHVHVCVCLLMCFYLKYIPLQPPTFAVL